MCFNRPDLGIYDTRVWDRDYHHWIMYKNKGARRPGQHPDPNCLWNTDPDNFDFREYSKE